MNKRHTLLLLCLVITQLVWAQHHHAGIKGRVLQENGEAIAAASVVLEHTRFGTITNDNGFFDIHKLPEGKYRVRAFSMGFESKTIEVELVRGETEEITFSLPDKANAVTEIEVFGERDKQPEKLDAITRLPLKPSEQIQSISIISERLIEQQGALTIIEGCAMCRAYTPTLPSAVCGKAFPPGASAVFRR